MANAIILLHDMCRLCLDEPGTLDILENDKLIRDILHCTGLRHISFRDNLPRKICSSCMYKIKTAKDLRRYSTNNALYLKSLLDNNTTVHKIARPKLPLGLVKPLEEIVKKKTKISVRSLADINSSVNPVNSLEKGETSHDKKTPNSPSPEHRKTETIKKQKSDICKQNVVIQSSSKKHKTSPKNNSQRSISTEYNKARDNSEHRCDICKKTFLTPRKLYMHRRSHSKSLYCPLDACSKMFATKGDLQKHIRSHTGEKPYKCHLCDKSFTQNVTLKSHMEAVHVEKM